MKRNNFVESFIYEFEDLFFHDFHLGLILFALFLSEIMKSVLFLGIFFKLENLRDSQFYNMRNFRIVVVVIVDSLGNLFVQDGEMFDLFFNFWILHHFADQRLK